MLRHILVVLLFMTAVQGSFANSHNTKIVFSDEAFSDENTKRYLENGYIFRSLESYSDNTYKSAVYYGCPSRHQASNLNTLYVCVNPSVVQSKRFVFLLPIPSPVKQVELAQNLLNVKKQSKRLNVGVLFSSNSESVFNHLETSLPDHININSLRSYGALKFNDHLNDLMNSNQMILALHDDNIFNISTQRALILSSYRNGKPVIGPDKRFVSSGSMLSLGVIEGDIVKASIALLKPVDTEEALKPGIHFPNASKLILNENVFKAFNLDVPNKRELDGMLNKLNAVGESHAK